MLKLVLLHLVNKSLNLLSIFSRKVREADWVAELRHKEQLIKLRGKGVTLGEKSVVYDTVFSTSARGDKFFIGKNCTITGSVLLGHDASPSLFLKELEVRNKPWLHGARRSYRDPIVIGDNVFVGYGSTILAGVKIGSNVIVAAGSVVAKDVPDNVIVAGNPAKVINTIDNYVEKYREKLATEPEKF